MMMVLSKSAMRVRRGGGLAGRRMPGLKKSLIPSLAAGLLTSLTLTATPASAQELVYSFAPTQECLDAADGRLAKRDCVGLSAATCMEDTEGGGSTVGMGGCFNAEWQSWDAWLNETYPAMMGRYRFDDAQNREAGSMAPPVADALQGMQRAWMSYRDGACSFEASLWGGGTGGGPAYVACLMDRTAEQVLYLEAFANMH